MCFRTRDELICAEDRLDLTRSPLHESGIDSPFLTDFYDPAESYDHVSILFWLDSDYWLLLL